SKIDLKHLFPVGNSIMQAEFHDKEGKIFIKSYNVFIGTPPSIALGNPGNTNFCLNDLAYFIVSSFEYNPPWTVYKFIVDDGSDTISFVNPEKKILKIPYQFKKASSNINYRKTTFTNWDHSFKATLIAENPCSYSSASIMPI